jgi:hypothetical protein
MKASCRCHIVAFVCRLTLTRARNSGFKVVLSSRSIRIEQPWCSTLAAIGTVPAKIESIGPGRQFLTVQSTTDLVSILAKFLLPMFDQRLKPLRMAGAHLLAELA